MTGKWRIGGYAGIGSSSISEGADVQLYVDTGVEGFDGEDVVAYDDNFAPNIEAKITLSLGAGSIEYVMPIFQDLEISAGAMMGLGRLNLSINQYAGNPVWEKLFDFAYGDRAWVPIDDNDPEADSTLTYYYAVDDTDVSPSGFNAVKAPGTMSDLSGTFFNFQPYVAIKWQLLDRVGLRISAGFNKGTIGQGRWKLNSRYLIGDSEEYSLQGVTFRTMLYLGL